MIIEILVKAYSNTNPDPIADRGSWKKGFPVVAKPAGWPWGGCECAPDFVKIRVTDAESLAQIEDYVKVWQRRTAYTILEHDPESDFFRVRIFSDNAKTQVVADEMRAFLLTWGAEEIIDDSGVVFEVTAIDALNNTGYLNYGEEEEHVIFTEIGYDAETGTHRVRMNYSTSILSDVMAETPLTNKQCNIISHDKDKAEIVFEAVRATMIGYLEAGVRERFDVMVGRSIYFFPEAVVDDALSRAGVLEMTVAEMDELIDDVREV